MHIKFTNMHTVPDGDVVYFLHDMEAHDMGSGVFSESYTPDEARQMVADGSITMPHFYSIPRDTGTYYYVPDGSQEHEFRSADAATNCLKRVMEELLSE